MEEVNEASIIYDTNSKIILKTDSLEANCTRWIADLDTLRIYPCQLSVPLYEPMYSNSDTLILSKGQINEVQINKFDEIRAIIYSAVIVGLIVLLISNMDYSYTDMDLEF
jgi:hypothetical protein